MGTSQNSMLGDFRGSINGVVGSRNASGSFFRAKVKPTNPKSLAQQQARAGFRQAGKIYGTLSDEVRAQWQEFSKNTFNPLKKANTGQYTAAQSLTAVLASISSSNSIMVTPTITGFGAVPPAVVLTNAQIPVSTVAPLFSINPDLKDTTAGPAYMSCIGAWLEADGTLTFDLRFEGLAGVGLGQGEFLDSNGLGFGFGGYISSSVNYASQRPATMLQSQLGFSGVLTVDDDDLAGLLGIRVEMDVSAQLARYKKFPVLDSYMKFTPILVGENGTQTKLNSVDIKFGTAPGTTPVA